MPESYTGTEGAAALAAGMSAMDGTEDRRQGWLAINKARDYIAQFFNEAKTYAAGLIPAVWPTNRGGTGSANLYGVTLPSSENSLLVVRSDGAIARGSGAIPQAYIPSGIPVSKIDGIDMSSRVAKSGDTMTGDLFLPNSSAATSGYTVAYINADGRVSRGASSERYKKYLSEIDPATLGDIWPTLTRYQMRHGDGAWKYGYIAERLDESGDLRPFVIYQSVTVLDENGEFSTTLALDENGQPIPDSIDFIALLLSQNAQLHQRLSALEGGAS